MDDYKQFFYNMVPGNFNKLRITVEVLTFLF